ncbi:MAG TPA: hypothetical protein VFO17_04190 [Acidimicrobiia bacterium]|nr:hypothetical protein [Acidimicrobiia bacterium]
MPALPLSVRRLIEDRLRLGRALVWIGIGGIVASLVVAIGGWLLASKATTALSETIEPFSGVITNLAESIEATRVIVDQTVDALESIESATRSTVRTLESVNTVLEETVTVAGEGVAGSLDATLETLPSLIATGRVVDRTMRALRLVGVDYDPEVPLDQALEDLGDSLAPLPGQMREVVALLDTVQDDVDQIADDARDLSAVLLQTRLEMVDADRVLAAASTNAATAAERVSQIEDDLSTYGGLAQVVAVVAALALMAPSLAPLLIGLHFGSRYPETSQTAT